MGGLRLLAARGLRRGFEGAVATRGWATAAHGGGHEAAHVRAAAAHGGATATCGGATAARGGGASAVCGVFINEIFVLPSNYMHALMVYFMIVEQL